MLADSGLWPPSPEMQLAASLALDVLGIWLLAHASRHHWLTRFIDWIEAKAARLVRRR